MTRVDMTPLFTDPPKRPAAAVTTPRRPAAQTCAGCKGGGFLLPQGVALPQPCTVEALVLAALPCGCAAGDEFRRWGVELAQPTLRKDSSVLSPGLAVPWL